MKNLTFKNNDNLVSLYMAYSHVQSLGEHYPNFYDWFWNKVVPGVQDGTDEVISAYIRNELVGISIIKNSDEKKLRALRIVDKFQNKGYGLHLIDESLKRLDMDKPLCSVNEDMINDYSRIFINRYDFDITHVYKGLYKKGKLEYEFNGKKKLDIKTMYGI